MVHVMRAVLEVSVPEGFDLWPVAGADASGFLALTGRLSPAEVGTAVTALAACNRPAGEGDDRPPRDAAGTFLRGLLSSDEVFAAGGLRVVDPGTGVAFVPGCCDGLEDWRDWYRLADGDGTLGFGHEPVSPAAERHGDTLRLTVDAERDDSPVIELPAHALRGMLAGVERDLAAFLDLAVAWAAVRVPGHDRALVAALARALDVPPPTGTT
ncbi:hypothetical protein [Streptomyces roseolus]|uniref:hypothetical protein n=1 Tax=Streptomyces roseolus TaxID=67358 RepID=UPI00199DF56C|nr:hypothetical protein [Streptomyces roseolus]GGR62612.1 hypothetical protein GCM10010282_64610 [Streptomyces roseolus]